FLGKAHERGTERRRRALDGIEGLLPALLTILRAELLAPLVRGLDGRLDGRLHLPADRDDLGASALRLLAQLRDHLAQVGDHGRRALLAGLAVLGEGHGESADARAEEGRENLAEPRGCVAHGSPHAGSACPLSSAKTSAIRPWSAASSSGSKLPHGSSA